MQVLWVLLLFYIKNCYPGFYSEDELNEFNGVVKHTEEKDSTLACLQTCTFMKLDAVYKDKQCYCVDSSEDGKSSDRIFSPVNQFKRMKLIPDPPASCNKLNCHDGIRNVGCFREDVEPLASMTMLSNNRSNIDWEPSGFRQFVHRLIGFCASKAREKNFKFFSIRYYGECYAGINKSALITMKSDVKTHSTKCDLGDGTYGTCTGQSDGRIVECVGTAGSDYVYLLTDL